MEFQYDVSPWTVVRPGGDRRGGEIEKSQQQHAREQESHDTLRRKRTEIPPQLNQQ